MNPLSNNWHPKRVIAIVLGLIVIAAAGIGLSRHFGAASESASGNTSPLSTAFLQQNTYLMHDGETLDSIVNVPEGTYLIVKSDQGDRDANVRVTENGGFIVEKGAVLVLENVNLSGDDEDRSTPVFAVYGDMVMNDGSVGDFSSTSLGASSDYGTGGAPAICVVDGTFTMNGGEITDNSNTTTSEVAFGGALRAEGSDAALIINDGTISGNTVVSSAVVRDGSTVTANALGGAIAVTEGASVTINGGEISGNTAGSHDENAEGADNAVCSGNGGGIAVYSSSSDTISSIFLDGGNIENNNAYRTDADKVATASADSETYGGGIFGSVYTKAVLNSGRIAGNTSDDKGGGVFLDCSKASGGATFKNTLVSGNEAEILGGGLWFCPDGEANMFSIAEGDGLAVFNNTTTRRGADGAGDDLYVSPRSDGSGVTVTGTMLGGGSNAWYQDGGAGTRDASNGSTRYASSTTVESATLLQASAVTNKPSEEATEQAIKSASLIITGNSATYGGGVASNQYLSFGTPTSEEEEEYNVPSETPEPEKISINVKKVWVGDEGTSATVHLIANGTEVASATLTADDNWSYTFTGLDQADSDGNEITYTLTEDVFEGYQSSITGDASSGFTVTNTQEIDIPVTKKWVGPEGSSATVHLLADDTVIANATLTADGSWTHTFEGVPKYDSDGEEIAYTVTEDAVEGYDSAVTSSVVDGFTVTNISTATTSVSVTKVWVGPEGDSATVRVMNGETEVASYELAADDEWTHTFTGLPKYDSDGNEIEYTVTEDAIEGYSSAVTENSNGSFTITNTNTETVDVSGTKVWDDNDDQDGIRPDSVTVSLLRDGEVVDSTTATADSDWSFSFEGLAKYDSTDGHEYTYTVEETDVPDGYTSAVTGSVSDGFTVTNSHTPETTSVSVTKEWVGPEGESATFALSADGADTGQTLTLTADGGWADSFDGLAKYDDGTAIAYTVTETDVPDCYASSSSGDASEGYVFTNTNTETVDVAGAVAWDDDGDRDGIRPSSVTVSLLRDDTSIDSATVAANSDGTWSFSFDGLAKYDSTDGHEYTYAVSESSVTGYTTAIAGSVSSGFTVTNTHAPETVSVPVTKEWVGPEGESATVHLLAGGADTGKTLTLTADDGWSGSFDGLYRYSSGSEIAYAVTEDAVDGYYSATITGDMTNGFTVTNVSDAEVGVRVVKDWRGMPEAVAVNLLADGVEIGSVTLDGEAGELTTDPDTGVEYGEDDAWVAVFTGLPKYDPETGAEIAYSVDEDAVSETSSVVGDPVTEGDVTTYTITNTRSATFQPTVTKEWGEGVASQQVTIQLKQGDDVVDEITLDGEPDEDAAASDTASGEYAAWQGRFEAVDKFDDHGAPIGYTVSEATTGDWVSSVSGNERTGFTIQNAPLGSASATLAASKTVNGGEVGGYAFSFELYEGTSTTGTPLQTVQNDHDGAVTFAPIVYTTTGTRTYTIVEKDEGATDVTYDGSAYTATVEVADSDGDGILDAPTVTYYDEDGQTVSAAVFDNTVITRTSVSFTKDWVGATGGSATVRLMRSTDGGDAEDTGLSVTVDGTADGLASDSDTGAEYGEDASWHGTFQDLVASDSDHTYSYTLVEDEVDGYESSVTGDASEGYVFTNAELTSVAVTKEWDDAGDQDGIRPGSATVQLYADGQASGGAVTLSSDNSWGYTWEGLPKYDSDGNAIEYAVAETSVPDGYTSSVTDNEDGTFTITNSHTPETTSVSVTKSWADEDDQDGIRPDSVTVQLYANGSASGDAVTLSSDNGWSYSWTDLPVYDNGSAITYTVEETEVPNGYTSSVTDNEDGTFTITNSHTPETTSVSVSKVWVGPAGTSATFALYADGTDTGKTLTLTADDEWSGSFTELAKYNSGTEIVYTVSETGMGGVNSSNYSTTVSGDASSGYVFTNTNTETVDVSGTKVWNDASDQDGKRPDSVTVNLLRDGTEVSTQTVTADSDGTWSFSFDDLAKYDSDGNEYTYTVSEDSVTGYTTTVAGDAASGFTITNSHTPETTSVTVTKAWNDGNDADGLRPDSVTVQLYANGQASGDAVTLSSGNDWTYTWTDLAVYDNGSAITYTVAETSVLDNYKSEVSGSSSDGFTITNTETVTVHVQKNWSRYYDETSVVVQLYSNGEATGSTLTLVRDDNDTVYYGWNGDFSDLPKYDSNGDEIEYTVVEEEVYWPDGNNYRDWYDCTPYYTSSGNTINCSLSNAFDSSGG